MKQAQIRIDYLAVFVFYTELRRSVVHSNVHGRKRAKSGQVVVASKNAVWQLIGARYYDPETATWGTRDKYGQFPNPYGYPNNPVIFVDKDGNFAFLIPILAVAAKAALVGAVLWGAVSGAVIAEATGHEWYQGALIDAGIGATAAFTGGIAGGLASAGLASSGAGFLATGAITNTVVGGAGNAWAFGGNEDVFTGSGEQIRQALTCPDRFTG